MLSVPASALGVSLAGAGTRSPQLQLTCSGWWGDSQGAGGRTSEIAEIGDNSRSGVVRVVLLSVWLLPKARSLLLDWHAPNACAPVKLRLKPWTSLSFRFSGKVAALGFRRVLSL